MWTLKTAKTDYEMSNTKCKNCSFSKVKKGVDHDMYYTREYTTITCNVKSQEVEDTEATKCKYYTLK